MKMILLNTSNNPRFITQYDSHIPMKDIKLNFFIIMTLYFDIMAKIQ